MSRSILLFLFSIICAHSQMFAQSTGLRWNEPDSVVLFSSQGAELVLRFTVTNTGTKTETMDVRIEGDTASWKLHATERGYAEDIVMMPTEHLWVDVKLTGPNASSTSAQLIADGSITADTLQLTGIAMYEGVAWGSDVLAFALRENETNRRSYALLSNMWMGEVNVYDLVIEGDKSWTVEQALPITLMPGEYEHVSIRFSPSEPGTYSARLIAKTIGISDTLLLIGTRPKSRGAHWSLDTMWFGPSSCVQETSQVVKLWNDGDLTVMVDSVSIAGLDASYFSILSSSPAGRINRSFALDPGNENTAIDYLIAFDPKGTTQPLTADLIVHTSQGNPVKVKLIGMVPAADVASIDTTFVGPAPGLGLALSVDHTFKLMIINEGEAPFQITNALWSGDLDVMLDSLTTKAILPAGGTKEISVVMRSAEAGTKSKLFKFNGSECDEPFEVKITAQFGEPSSVERSESSKVLLRLDGNSIIVDHHIAGTLSYRVIDLTGRVVLSGEAAVGAVIDISSLPSGAYMFDLGNKHSIKFWKD